jgi:hypothetical protein
MPPAIIRRAEHALDHAHGAADPSADRAPDDAADRARDPAAFIGSLLRAAHDALGVAGARRQEQCKQDDSRHEDERERQEGRPHRALSLGFPHFDPLNLSPEAREFEPALRPNGCASVANSRRDWVTRISLRSRQGARIHTSRSSSVVRITGIAFGWIGSTTAFGDVVRKP